MPDRSPERSPFEVRKLAVSEETAATLIEVKPVTLQRWRREGRGPPWFRLSRLVRYRVCDLERFIAQQRGR